MFDNLRQPAASISCLSHCISKVAQRQHRSPTETDRRRSFARRATLVTQPRCAAAARPPAPVVYESELARILCIPSLYTKSNTGYLTAQRNSVPLQLQGTSWKAKRKPEQEDDREDASQRRDTTNATTESKQNTSRRPVCSDASRSSRAA